jgi:hypothetical protein
MDILYRITHDANFNTAIQALILIQQVVLAKQVFPVALCANPLDLLRSILSYIIRIIA